MGRKDEQDGIGEKQQASSFEGLNQTPNSEVKPEKEESNKEYWGRIVKNTVSKITISF